MILDYKHVHIPRYFSGILERVFTRNLATLEVECFTSCRQFRHADDDRLPMHELEEVYCLRTTMPSMSGLRRARAFFHDLPNRSFNANAQQRVSFVTRENIERSFMVLREGHQLDRTELQHVQV